MVTKVDWNWLVVPGRWQPSDDGASSWHQGGSSTPRTESGGCSITKTITDDITIAQRSRNDKRPATSQSSSSSSSSAQHLLNTLNPLSLNSEQLSVMHQKLQNNLQSLQVTSSAKYLQSCDPYQAHHTAGLSLTDRPKCPECGKIYSNNSNLKQHIVNVHTVQTQYLVCHICHKQFKTKQYLQIHLLSMHNIRKRKKYPGYLMPGAPAHHNDRHLESAQMNLAQQQQYGSVEGWSDDKNWLEFLDGKKLRGTNEQNSPWFFYRKIWNTGVIIITNYFSNSLVNEGQLPWRLNRHN